MRRRPNILFVFADQHRAAATGCYGNREVRTPTIDRLAEQGLRALNMISNAPLCQPYRASLMTGMYAFKCGAPANFQTFRPPVACIGNVLRKAGYAMGYVGKLHLYFPTGDRSIDNGPDIDSEWVPLGSARLGFDDYWRGINEGHDFHDWHYFRQDDPTPVHCREYMPYVQTDQALEFIRDQENRNREWCLFVSWTPPHPPFHPPLGMAERYRNLSIPANVPEGSPRDYFRKSAPQYYACIESIDVALERLLAGLKSAGADENTIVVYTADHGELLAAHGYMGHKRWPYDESLRVPFIIRGPRIPSGKTLTKPIAAIDLYPTLLELPGVELPQAVDGKSAAHAIRTGDESKRDDFVYCQMHYSYVPWPGWKGLRSERYLYARTVESPWLLFDLHADPLEMNNLINKRSHRGLREELDATLTRRMKEAGDSWDFRLDTGDTKDYADVRLGKQVINDMGFAWPGGPHPFSYDTL
ncbi:MAG TPA: sulfatase-like hydrolase/transferase [Planctomycetota bacterium]|nr:sulfatase-like hydrolase/transferase [Planctomycetota bacterium]